MMTKIELKYLLLIIAIFIAACIETDIYLPAFPDMMRYFKVSEEAIQALLTWNFVGICLSGPLYGPISDSFGRKKPLLASLSLFFLGSVMTLLTDNYDVMLWGRFLQGIGSGGCFTLGTAVIFDAFQAEKAVKALNTLNSTIPFIMALAPLLGGYLNYTYGFRSNFAAIAFFVLISLLISLFFFDEPLAKEKWRPFDSRKILADFKRALTCLPFWQLTIAVCLMFSVYLAFLSISAVLFVEEFGVSKELFPFLQAVLLISWLIASLTSSRALSVWGPQKVKLVGTALLVVGAVGFTILAFLFPRDPYLMTAMMAIFAFGANWSQGLYFPESMELMPDIKGVTASLITSFRLLITAITIGITSAFYDGSIYPVIGMIAILTTVILAMVVWFETGRAKVVDFS